MSEIFLSDNAFAKAIPVLKRLETEANFPQNVIFARSNLMKSYYLTQDYSNTVTYGEKVLADPKIDTQVKTDVHLFIARAAVKTDNMTRAKGAYAEVLKTATNKTAAEATYYKAYFENQEGRHEQVKTTVTGLVQQLGGYKLYVAKGLVLMADSYNKLGDAYQATYLLEGVQKNFTQFPEVVEEATTLLNAIKAQQAKTNASVETEEN